jgi:hypothetical protein
MNKRLRLNPSIRKSEVLAAALTVARKVGYMSVNRGQIAQQAGCSDTLVCHYLGTVNQMRRAIMGEAIRINDLDIIAQGLAVNDSRALRVEDNIKRAAAAKFF